MKFRTVIFTCLNLILVFPMILWAEEKPEFVPLVSLPVETGGSFESFINSLYYLSIGIAALLAVIKIIIAGVKYMVTDIVTTKGDAKGEIKGALLGLLVVLGAVMILEIINPQLTNINPNLETVTSPQNTQAPSDNTAKNEIIDIIRGGGAFIKDINDQSHDLIPTPTLPQPAIPEDQRDEWICKNVVPDNCPYKEGSYVFGSINAGASKAFCYKGEWNPGENGCVVTKANNKLPPANAAKNSLTIDDFDTEAYEGTYNTDNENNQKQPANESAGESEE